MIEADLRDETERRGKAVTRLGGEFLLSGRCDLPQADLDEYGLLSVVRQFDARRYEQERADVRLAQERLDLVRRKPAAEAVGERVGRLVLFAGLALEAE